MPTDSMAANLRRWRIAVATHDVENPKHTSFGIGLSHFDANRLGVEDGEELWDGIRVGIDGGTSGNFRVLCDGNHDECNPRDKEEAEKPKVEDDVREAALA